jgi:BirA family biotin operon repressor/biotin-[acetyl-CoA-carboxylase] ligase
MPEPAAIRRVPRAGPGEPSWEVRRYRSVDSTNRLLLDEARAGAPEGLVVVADHQSAGRGRLGRSWEAAPGSALLVSVLVRPRLAPGRLGRVTLAAGSALAEALADTAAVGALLKWPNDLVVPGPSGPRKLAGILAEADLGPGAGPGPGPGAAVVVGIGVNLAADAYPAELAGLATAGAAEGRPVAVDDLLDAFLAAFDRRLGRLDAAVDEARARSATLGTRVRVERGSAPDLVGTALDLDPDGALLVRDDGGVVHTVTAGDVVHLRAAPGA